MKKFFFTTLFGLAPWSFIFGSIGQGLEEIFINKTELNHEVHKCTFINHCFKPS